MNDHTAIKRHSEPKNIVPIAPGKREFTRFDFRDLLERRALDIAQPDVTRLRGLIGIRRIAR